MRTRFAPSPTGNVHIGNIRVAIFNWLFARHNNGEFLIRVEDTDLERSTPQAIKKMFDALTWLGIDYDAEPLYQTSERATHEAAVKKMIDANHASNKGEGEPVFLRIHAGLFDPSFVSEPREQATIIWKNGELIADRETITHTVTSPKSGETYVTPVNWDTLTDPVFILDNGTEINAQNIRNQLATESVELSSLTGATVAAVKFKRRYVFFDDLVLGRREKPVDSLRNMVIVRSDGSPVFHIANVVDDATQEVTHILRGNDHIENTFRHLFIFQALGLTPPQYGHFPMIVNAKGKPYSKRDGDAYIGDFQEKGFLPEALFNFLALCGWSPGDDREIMTLEEMKESFTLERVNASAAQFDLQKLEWMNQQYMVSLPPEKLCAILLKETTKAGLSHDGRPQGWFAALVETQRERISKPADFVTNTVYFFNSDFSYDPKAVKKNLLKNDGEGLINLAKVMEAIKEINDWQPTIIEEALNTFAQNNELMMGMVAQPLRIACTGGTVSPGIGDTLFLIGKAETISRIERALNNIKPE